MLASYQQLAHIYVFRRKITEQLYQGPQIPEEVSFPNIVDTLYDRDHRRALIEHPRIRYDGVYIAVCHCVYLENLFLSLEPAH